jgi:DnaJ-class molecular chaperone
VIPKSQVCKFQNRIAVYELLIDPVRAMLGCRMKATGLKPKEELLIDIPNMTEPHTQIVLKNKGLCDMNGHRHDAVVIVVYKMPKELSDKQKEILNEYLTTDQKSQEKQTK